MSDPALSVLSDAQSPSSAAEPAAALAPTAAGAAELVQVPAETASLLASLPAVQRKVMVRLGNGASIANAAYSCGVCRMTVYRWIKKPGPFRRAYDRWRKELVESSQARLLQLLDEAVDTVQSAIIDGKVEVALEVLRTMGALTKPKPRRAATGSGRKDAIQRDD